MELGVDYEISKISAETKTSNFKTGNSSFLPLKTFLTKQALDFQNSLVAQTYIAKNKTNNVLGYITLTCSEVDLRNGYTVEDCPNANKYDSLPAVKIARLAIDKRYQGKGIGKVLMDLAVAISNDVIGDNVGCRFLITDAKKEAVTFYKKYGFTLLDTDDNNQAENPVMFIDLLTNI